jgi:hypothetical protein
MNDNGLRRAWTITGLILLILVAVVLIVRQAMAPRETVRDPIKNPPAEALRGAGRL